MLNVSVEEKGNTLYLALSGRMDGGPCCESLKSTVKIWISEGHRRVVFDLGDLTSMSSCGIGCLVSSYASIQSAQGSMVLLSPNERVQHVLEVTHLVPAVFDVIQTHDRISPGNPSSPPRSVKDETQVDASGRSARA
jgi:anti-anti-sigma factor